MMYELLNRGLHSRRGLIRKGSALLLQASKQITRGRPTDAEYAANPPVLANSFPKSGTHLLDQIVAGLPERVNYGVFLSSMTSSFQYRLRSPESTGRIIAGALPGEIVRAHLYYEPEYDEALQSIHFVHYFIYRDLRDVVVSSSHYLRHMNPWHRLSRTVRALPSDEAGVLFFIEGLENGAADSPLPNITERFRCYEGWVSCPNVCAVRYEDLVGHDSDATLRRMVEFYAARARQPIDVDETVVRIRSLVAPEKSHTFRAGKRRGWQEVFTPDLKSAFKRVAGDLLVRLGYEKDHSW
jgi:hypothetical protein